MEENFLPNSSNFKSLLLFRISSSIIMFRLRQSFLILLLLDTNMKMMMMNIIKMMKKFCIIIVKNLLQDLLHLIIKRELHPENQVLLVLKNRNRKDQCLLHQCLFVQSLLLLLHIVIKDQIQQPVW